MLKKGMLKYKKNNVRKSIAFLVTIVLILNISVAIGTHIPNTTYSLSDLDRAIEWNVSMLFSETSGKNDILFFGEAPDASDNVDSYDSPNPPNGPDPYIDAYFTTSFPAPFHKLIQEIKQYPDSYKIWNFTVYWTDIDTTVTISWNSNEVDDSEYNAVFLCDGFVTGGAGCIWRDGLCREFASAGDRYPHRSGRSMRQCTWLDP